MYSQIDVRGCVPVLVLVVYLTSNIILVISRALLCSTIIT